MSGRWLSLPRGRGLDQIWRIGIRGLNATLTAALLFHSPLAAALALALTAVIAAYFPTRYLPAAGFAVPWAPFVPAAGMVINLFLIGTLNPFAFLFWVLWMAASVCIYLFYGEGGV